MHCRRPLSALIGALFCAFLAGACGSGVSSDPLATPPSSETVAAGGQAPSAFVTENCQQAEGMATLSYEASGGSFDVLSSKTASSTVLHSSIKLSDTEWSAWYCFDSLLKPDRLAAGALLNGNAEVYATTKCGDLHRRTQFWDGMWLPWQPFSLPEVGAAVTDVAASVSADGVNVVYVADGGRVFVRHRLDAYSYATYGDWSEISGASQASVLTAGLRSDGRQQVVAVDADGTVRTAIQSTGDLDSAFGPWLEFGSNHLPAPLVDVEAPHGGPLPLEVFAVDSNGTFWQRAQNTVTHEFQPWQTWNGPPPFITFVALSGASVKSAPGSPLQLTALSDKGGVYTLRRVAGAWLTWHQL